jgi:hypothetical protein
MPASSDDAPADRHPLRAIVLWTTFTALLVLGVVLYFRYRDRVLPFLDAAGDR